MDMSGKTALKLMDKTGLQEIRKDDLKTGIYLIRVVSATGTATFKVVN
jgi:hypothetical protein